MLPSHRVQIPKHDRNYCDKVVGLVSMTEMGRQPLICTVPPQLTGNHKIDFGTQYFARCAREDLYTQREQLKRMAAHKPPRPRHWDAIKEIFAWTFHGCRNSRQTKWPVGKAPSFQPARPPVPWRLRNRAPHRPTQGFANPPYRDARPPRLRGATGSWGTPSPEKVRQNARDRRAPVGIRRGARGWAIKSLGAAVYACIYVRYIHADTDAADPPATTLPCHVQPKG